jgi:hypothetical protein
MKISFAFLIVGSLLLGGVSRLAAADLKPAVATNAPPDLNHFGVRPIGDWQVAPVETQYVDSLFANAVAARNAIVPGLDATSQQRAVDNLLRSELENFVATNANSLSPANSSQKTSWNFPAQPTDSRQPTW